MKKYAAPIHPLASSISSVSWGPIGILIYLTKFKDKILGDMVVNMVDVGEETGNLIKCSTRSPTFTTKKSNLPIS